jgi:ubiquinone/menaquinone biosynthesis C-methylase UbiE
MGLLKNFRKYILPEKSEKEAVAAYDLWAPAYDCQPDNLMLYLDEEVFDQLLHLVSLENKVVIDIGCGTGRHWKKMLDRGPAQLVGYDVSDGMLTELKKKFPGAQVQIATDNILSGVRDESVDVLVSTLTIAHIEDIESCFAAWRRVLKTGGSILLTDFHPVILANGGKRDFTIEKQHIVIRNYVHPLSRIKALAVKNNFEVRLQLERFIDEAVRSFYEKQNALDVYERYKDKPIIYALHLTKL